ncbi:hypothetical protein E4U51_007302, partial [Claviceps purpurea]
DFRVPAKSFPLIVSTTLLPLSVELMILVLPFSKLDEPSAERDSSCLVIYPITVNVMALLFLTVLIRIPKNDLSFA